MRTRLFEALCTAARIVHALLWTAMCLGGATLVALATARVHGLLVAHLIFTVQSGLVAAGFAFWARRELLGPPTRITVDQEGHIRARHPARQPEGPRARRMPRGLRTVLPGVVLAAALGTGPAPGPGRRRAAPLLALTSRPAIVRKGHTS